MGNNNKLAIVVSFAATTIKEKKCDISKLAIIAHFHYHRIV
jgi:hypothetical protein